MSPASSMAFWGLEIKPGKAPTPLNLERRLVIKQAALSVSKSSPEPVVLSVSTKATGGQQFVVCRLHEGKVEHCPLELPFTPEDQPKVHLKGAHAVHLTGFLEMEDEDELEEGEDMEDATATKVAAPKVANGQAKTEEVTSGEEEEDDDDEFDEDDDDDEDDGEEEDDDEDGEEEEEDEEDESEDEDAAPPKAGKRLPPAAAAPAPKKAKAAEPKAAAPKATPAATPGAKATAPKTTPTASPGANSWSAAEDQKLQKALAKIGADVENRWDKVAKEVGTRNKEQCKKRQKALAKP